MSKQQIMDRSAARLNEILGQLEEQRDASGDLAEVAALNVEIHLFRKFAEEARR